MLRRLILLLWLSLTAVALFGTARTILLLVDDPSLQPVRTAARDEIVAGIEALMAQAATAEAIEARLRERLKEEPRNWLALDALIDLAQERDIVLAAAVLAEVGQHRDDDFSYLNLMQSCAVCAFDVAQCSITEFMLCQGPVAMTPVGDIFGVARAGTASLSGGEVDQVDLALSVVGLGATLVVIGVPVASAAVKAGAGLAKSAWKMGRLSPRLVAVATKAVKEGVNWSALPGVRTMDDLTMALRPAKFTELTETMVDLDRLWGATDATTALHLLPLVDNADDARHLANVAEALGPKVVGRAEILGKARLVRVALRVTGMAWALLSTAMASMVCLASLLTCLLEGRFRRGLRHLSRL